LVRTEETKKSKIIVYIKKPVQRGKIEKEWGKSIHPQNKPVKSREGRLPPLARERNVKEEPQLCRKNEEAGTR